MTTTLPSTPATPPVVPGFTVGPLLGFGAHGEVWQGIDDTSGVTYALKVGRPPGPADPPDTGPPDTGAPGQDEVALLARVRHPHVVRLHRVVPMAAGNLALVLEHAAGGSLGALVAGRAALDPAEVTTLLVPLAQALTYLHGRGLAHGDLSPGNVLLARDGRPLLSDLGVARVLGTAGRGPHGTPGFTDPALSRGADPRAGDVWGLGAIGWFALTGAAPPPGRPVPPLSAARVPGLTALLAECLSHDPECRPSPAEVAERAHQAVRPAPLRLLPPMDMVGVLRADVAAGLTTRKVPVAPEPEPPAAEPPSRWSLRRWFLRPSARRTRHTPSADRLVRVSAPAARPAGTPVDAAGPRRPGAAGTPGAPTVEPRGRPRGAGTGPGAAGQGTAVRPITPLRAGSGPSVATRPAAGGRSTGVVRAGAPPARGSARRWTVATVTTALVVGGGVALGAAAWTPGGAAGPGPAPTAQAPAPPPDGAGPEQALARAVTEIAEARAAAFGAASVDPLARADEHGSPAMAADVAVVRHLAGRGLRLDGVRYEVSGLHVLRQDGRSAALRATVRTSAHRQVTRAGGVVAEIPADDPRTVTLTLVAAGNGGWRVRSVS